MTALLLVAFLFSFQFSRVVVAAISFKCLPGKSIILHRFSRNFPLELCMPFFAALHLFLMTFSKWTIFLFVSFQHHSLLNFSFHDAYSFWCSRDFFSEHRESLEYIYQMREGAGEKWMRKCLHFVTPLDMLHVSRGWRYVLYLHQNTRWNYKNTTLTVRS